MLYGVKIQVHVKNATDRIAILPICKPFHVFQRASMSNGDGDIANNLFKCMQ